MTAHPKLKTFVLALTAVGALIAGLPMNAAAQPPPHDQRQDENRSQDRDPRGQQQPDNQKPRQTSAPPERQHSEPARGQKQPTAGPQPRQQTAGPQSYQFRDDDRSKLQRHYKRSLDNVNRSRRPHFEAGGHIPAPYRHAITEAPESLRRRMPPPPQGYRIGYYQGYSVVYDPNTFLILSVLDLLN